VPGEVRLETVVDVAPDRLWRLLVDWERQGDWIPLTRVWQVDGPRLGLGTRIAARTGIGPVGFVDRMTVTAVDAAHRYEVVHTGRVVKGVGAFVVEPDGTRTRFCWWERVEVPGGPLARPIWWVAGPLTRLSFGWALRRLRRLAEAEARAEAGAAGLPAVP
jgi:carbon monoxide dehydrogenase subunit G